VNTVNFDVCKYYPKLIGYHSYLPCTTAKLRQFYNPHTCLYQSWNVGEDSLVVVQIFNEKIGKLYILHENCWILSTSAKFSAVRPLHPTHYFSATKHSTYSSYCLGAVAPQKIGRGKTRKFGQISPKDRQSEECNFETLPHINKRIADLSCAINGLKESTKIQPVLMQPREKIGKL